VTIGYNKDKMNFQVPQFIDIEDPIFGPLTFKQFMYIIGGGGLAFLFYVLPLPIYLKGIPMVASVAFGVALAFYKVNNRPLPIVMEYAIRYFLSNKLYLWKKGEPSADKTAPIKPTGPKIAVPKLTESRLKDLSWSLDIQTKTK